MNETEVSMGLDTLVKNTSDMVELVLPNVQRSHRHIEYLPYPDSNFVEINPDCSDDHCELSTVYSRSKRTFIYEVPVEITNIEAEQNYNPLKDFLSPYLYSITIRHGPNIVWTIKKRYSHFRDLHKSLRDYVESELGRSVSSLNKSHLSNSSKSNNRDEQNSFIKQHEDQPAFPTYNDRMAMLTHTSIKDRCKQLQDYLNKVLKHPKFREHFAMREFLEISPLSFVKCLGTSVKEGAVAKRSNDDFRGRSIFLRMPFMCDRCKFHHGQKWFVLKESYLVYMNLDSTLIGFPMLIDRTFSIQEGFKKTGTNNGVRIKNLQRSMIIKFEKEYDRDEWYDALKSVIEKSPFIEMHPFGSYAPKRSRQYAQWFINGQSYMEAVAKAILTAKEEIFITDWWLSPEVLLVRPCYDDSMRLDNLLGKRAEEGIRVYVMVFKDIVQLVGLNSWYTKVRLMSKSPQKKNIKVIRHPDHSVMPGAESSFLFSHHEKTVVVDQKVAFIGGIDLCWGRWDTDQHKLVDLGDENIRELKLYVEMKKEVPEPAQVPVQIVGEMAQNTVNQNMDNVPSMEKSISNGNNNANNVVLEHQESQNLCVTDFQKELNIREKQVLAEEAEAEQHPISHKKKWRKILKKHHRIRFEDSSDEDEEIPTDETIKEQPKPNNVTTIADEKYRYFIGKDYSNSYEKDFECIDRFDEDYIDRKSASRMPWHDEALVVTGEAARDCARHFIQRWNVHKADKFRYNDFYPYILPKSYTDSDLFDSSMLRSILGDERPPILVDAQCVRSVSYWSCGTRTVEHSIQNAYIHMIDSSQHFVYIENQFFVSIADDTTIRNGIGDALYRRIIRAHINKEKFRVYVVIPLLPGFSSINSVQAVLYFIMRSINKGETSLYQRLKKSGVHNPQDYITFYGMRNWDILMGEIITEIIYVHSKLMIVDDRMCICGSANINDRSLQGSRDSEFCLVVNDIEMVDSTIDGQQRKVGKFCSTWRKKLFQQLLGVGVNNDINVDDPCSDAFYEKFRQIAKKNSQIYEEVFNTIPTNEIRYFTDIEAYTQRPKLKVTDPLLSHQKCKEIQGFIVEFPIDFLDGDVLMPKLSTSEGIAPVLLWT